ncbi:MAG: response regulator [Candidatus Korobacteraceae bacterium]
MRALIVDDSSSMRAILRRTMQQRGFEVIEAKNGLEVLTTLPQSCPVDFILIDWNMPLMNGFELLQRIRGEDKYAGTKIVMVTTETNKAEMTHALASGAGEYIMKPFTASVLHDKLRLIGLSEPSLEEVKCC